MDIRETGQKIVKLRHNNKITQEELAEKIGVSSQAVSKWENGKNLPDIEHLMDIAKLFNVPYSFFIEDENDEHLEYRSRLFNEDNMYTKVKTFAQFEGLEQTLKSLELNLSNILQRILLQKYTIQLLQHISIKLMCNLFQILLKIIFHLKQMLMQYILRKILI